MSYYLNETGIQVARRVVNIISYSCPDITYAPSLYPITCLLLHYMSGILTLFSFSLFGTFSCYILILILFVCLFICLFSFLSRFCLVFSEEDCYACVSQMVASKKTKFITQTKLHFETIWRTSMILCRRHAVKHANICISRRIFFNVWFISFYAEICRFVPR